MLRSRGSNPRVGSEGLEGKVLRECRSTDRTSRFDRDDGGSIPSTPMAAKRPSEHAVRVAQLVEATGLNPVSCGFKSRHAQSRKSRRL